MLLFWLGQLSEPPTPKTWALPLPSQDHHAAAYLLAEPEQGRLQNDTIHTLY